jgi:hypothetical protein
VIKLAKDKPSRISRKDQDRIVLLFSKMEQESRCLSDTGYKCLFVAMDIIAKSAKYDTSSIRTILLIGTSMSNNVEFSESLPCYLQEAIKSNPIGFIHMLQKMNSTEREDILSDANWACDLNLKAVFEQTSKSSSDKEIKLTAEWLVKVFESTVAP